MIGLGCLLISLLSLSDRARATWVMHRPHEFNSVPTVTPEPNFEIHNLPYKVCPIFFCLRNVAYLHSVKFQSLHCVQEYGHTRCVLLLVLHVSISNPALWHRLHFISLSFLKCRRCAESVPFNADFLTVFDLFLVGCHFGFLSLGPTPCITEDYLWESRLLVRHVRTVLPITSFYS